jgi:hypothetical protein
MKNVIALLTVLFALSFNSSFVQAELQAGLQAELQAGQKYQAGSSLKSTYFGVSTKIPKGMVATFTEADGRQALAGGSPDGSLIFLMIFQYGLNAQTYNSLLSQPMPLGQVTLQPTSAPNKQSVQTADLEKGIIGQTTVLGGANSSLLLIAFALQGNEAQVSGLVNAFRADTKFGKSLAGNGDAKTTQALTQFLSGKLLVRSAGTSNNSVNGLGSSSNDSRMVLCSDQTFESNNTSSISISVPDSSVSEGSTESSQGHWMVEFANQNGAILTLTDQSGIQRRMKVRVVGGNEFVRLNEAAWRVFKTDC